MLKLRQVVRRQSLAEQSNISKGLFFSAGLSGIAAYVAYRKYIQEEFLVSHGHYKLSEKI